MSAGVAWAPSLPEDWQGAKLRWLASIYAGGTPSRDEPAYWTDGTIPWLNSGAVNDWRITEPSERITSEALINSSARWVEPGSVLVALAGQGRTKGLAARLEIRSTCNQSMAAIVPGSRLDYRYLHYWLTANYANVRSLGGGDLRDGLNLQHIGSIECPVPPIGEQRRIADFLDDQVARIDSIVSSRRHQQELLTDLRESVVTDLILDGGDVVLGPAKRFVWIERGHSTSEVNLNIDGIGERYLRTSDLMYGVPTDTADGRFVTEPTDDLVRKSASQPVLTIEGFSRGDGNSTVGVVCWSGEGVLNNHVVRTRTRDTTVVSERFAELIVAASFNTRLVRAAAQGAISQSSAHVLPELLVPLIEPAKQAQITAAIDERLAVVDLLQDAMRHQCAMLLERKQSLITAAVTGGLDVTTARTGVLA